MNGPESNPCAYPMRRPPLSSAPARLAARAAANRQARAEPGGRGRWSSAKLGPTAASAAMDVTRCLDELAHAVALVRLGGEPLRRPAGQRPQALAHPRHVR